MSLKLTKKPGVSSSLLNDSMGEDDLRPRTRSGSRSRDDMQPTTAKKKLDKLNTSLSDSGKKGQSKAQSTRALGLDVDDSPVDLVQNNPSVLTSPARSRRIALDEELKNDGDNLDLVLT